MQIWKAGKNISKFRKTVVCNKLLSFMLISVLLINTMTGCAEQHRESYLDTQKGTDEDMITETIPLSELDMTEDEGAENYGDAAQTDDRVGLSEADDADESAQIETVSDNEMTVSNDDAAGIANMSGKAGTEIERILSSMTLEEKIYQLFIVTPEQLTGGSTVVSVDESFKDTLAKKPVGGLIYFSSNIVDPEQTGNMLSDTQSFAREIEGIPLFLSVDEEGGQVVRLAGNSAFNLKNVGAMANIKSEQEAFETGNYIGNYLSAYGFNLDFAPDTDVLTNSRNRVIGNRSFGSDPENVSNFGKAYSDGLHANGILSTFKHFPGHGATTDDTHKGYAYTDKSYEELEENELIPFKHAGEYGVDLVMVAHIAVPNVTGDDTPSSLSEKMVNEILRKKYRFNGLIVTDALNMGAISQNYKSGEAAKKAVKAGCDLLLMPANLDLAHSAVLEAVRKGEISEERINESLRRIISVKLRNC